MQKLWYNEFLSWGAVALICVLILYPIYFKVGDKFEFYLSNTISIILFLTFTRLIFLLKYTPFARMKWLKLCCIFLAIPMFLYQIDGLYDFQRFLDERGTVSLFLNSFDMSNYNFGKYIKFEYLFFCIGSLLTIALLPIRMIISFWRTTNTADRV